MPLLLATLLVASRWAAIVLPADVTDEELAQNLSEVLVARVAGETHAAMVGREELRTHLGLSDRGLLGCAGDTACLGRVGVSLKVDKMIVGTVSRGVGDEFVINLSLVDVAKLQVERGELRKVHGLTLLVREVQSIAALFCRNPQAPPEAPASQVAPAAITPVPVASSSSAPRYRTAAWVTLLSGGALLGTGLVMGLLAHSKASDIEQLASQHGSFDAAAQKVESDGQNLQNLSYLFGATGAAAVIGAGVLFYLGRPVTVASDGRTLSLAGRF